MSKKSSSKSSSSQSTTTNTTATNVEDTEGGFVITNSEGITVTDGGIIENAFDFLESSQVITAQTFAEALGGQQEAYRTSVEELRIANVDANTGGLGTAVKGGLILAGVLGGVYLWKRK